LPALQNGITPREHFLPHACGAGTGCARKRRHYSGFSSIVNRAGLKRAFGRWLSSPGPREFATAPPDDAMAQTPLPRFHAGARPARATGYRLTRGVRP
jgi:hypothetical protein